MCFLLMHIWRRITNEMLCMICASNFNTVPCYQHLTVIPLSFADHFTTFQKAFAGKMLWKTLVCLLIAAYQVNAQNFIQPDAYPYRPGAFRQMLHIAFSCSLPQLRQGGLVVYDRRSVYGLRRRFPAGTRRMKSTKTDSSTNT